ncbi:hypothetical protein ACLKA7_013042 [Drosophila subpalustris]
MNSLEKLIQNSPWKEFASNTNYAFDPYGETEEKHMTSSTTAKEKARNRSTASSQQTTLPMSHSPTSKSQMYYENSNVNGNGHGHGKSGNGNGNANSRSNGRHMTQESSVGGSTSTAPGPYSRGSYAERAYSLPRQNHQYQQSSSNMQPSGYYTHDRRAVRQERERQERERERGEERRHRHERDSSYDRSRDDPRLNGGADTPDFYFMPSQRKYSGEVVRVYVDYNKDPKN